MLPFVPSCCASCGTCSAHLKLTPCVRPNDIDDVKIESPGETSPCQCCDRTPLPQEVHDYLNGAFDYELESFDCHRTAKMYISGLKEEAKGWCLGETG